MGSVSPPQKGTARARRVILLVLAAFMVVQAGAALGQITFGATLTVIRGPVSVVRGNGSAVSPAPSGTTLEAGDRVATIGKASALVTFFDGSEVELGADTTIAIVDASSGNGNLVSIIIENILGSTVHKVATLTNPGSTYKIVAGGTVTEVHGTTIGNSVDGQGNVTTYLQESRGKVTFPNSGTTLHDGEICTATADGDLRCTDAKGQNIWSGIADVVDAGAPKSGAPGLSNTSKKNEARDSKSSPEPEEPTATPTLEPTPTPTPPRRQQQP